MRKRDGLAIEDRDMAYLAFTMAQIAEENRGLHGHVDGQQLRSKYRTLTGHKIKKRD